MTLFCALGTLGGSFWFEGLAAGGDPKVSRPGFFRQVFRPAG